MGKNHKTGANEASTVEDTGDLSCPSCLTRGRLGDSNFGEIRYDYSIDKPASISTTCSKCRTPIPLSTENLALSDELYFAVQAFLGPMGISTPLDRPVSLSASETKTDGTSRGLSKATIELDAGGTPFVTSKSQFVIDMGKKPLFAVIPGVTKSHRLGRAFETVLPVTLMLKGPSSLVGHVRIEGRVEPDPHHKNDTLYVILSVDSAARLSTAPCNVLCKVCGIPRDTDLRVWVKLYVEAIGHAMANMPATAILDYARACEAFVEEYIQEMLVGTGVCNQPMAKWLLEKHWSIEQRIESIMPLIFDASSTEWERITDKWGDCLQRPRNSERVAHGTHRKSGDSKTPKPALSFEQAEEARKAAFMLIRGMQKRSPAGRQSGWDYWLHTGEPTTGPCPSNANCPGLV